MILRSFFPAIRMTMFVPVIHTIIQGLGEFIQGFKAAPFQCQGSQLLPPRLDQVQPASIFGNKLQLHFWPGCQGQFDRSTDMDGQVILDDQPTIRWECNHNLFQQLHMAGAIAPWAGQDHRLPGGGFKPTMHPQLATSPIIWFKSRPVRTRFPFFSRIGFYRNRSHFIYTDHPGAWWRSR